MDFVNGDCWKINLAKFSIKASRNCNGIIIRHYKNAFKMILLWFKVKNGISCIHIPNDILSLIELFHGDYYNMRLHLFDEWIDDEKRLNDHSYHRSISLGIVINEYLQKNTNANGFDQRYSELEENKETLWDTSGRNIDLMIFCLQVLNRDRYTEDNRIQFFDDNDQDSPVSDCQSEQEVL